MNENFKTSIIAKEKIRAGQGVDFSGNLADGVCYGVAKYSGYKNQWLEIETLGNIKAIPGEVIQKGDKVTFKKGFVYKCSDYEKPAGYALSDADENAEYIFIFKTGV